MRYRIALTTAGVVVGLGLVGAVSGPGWDPVPLTETVDVATADTTIDVGVVTDPVGTYEVATSVVDVSLTGHDVQARVAQPLGAQGPRPGVVFVHGAGTGRFEDAFVDHAHALASAGVVTLVPDKRLDTYTTRDRQYPAMANDYLRSVQLLRDLPGVDPDRVGVYGESEGGWIVPLMAADNPSVAFTVLVAAPVVPPRQQAAFAVDSYLRNIGVPDSLLRSIPRFVGMEIPGGGFEYTRFDVRPFQQRMRQPVLIGYGTGDEAMPIVQAPLQLVADLEVAGNEDWTLRYYRDANHGMRIDGELCEDFVRDLAHWVQALPHSAGAEPRVAGAEPYQRFVAGPVERPRWYAEGDLLVVSLVASFLAVATGPVVWAVRRVLRRPGTMMAEGVRAPLITLGAGCVVTFAALAVYLLTVAHLAQNYRTSVAVVQGGWFALRMLGVVTVLAGVVLVYRILDGRRRGGVPAARGTAGEWVLASTVGGAVMLLLSAAYWGVFPALV
ncbi:alpha/beta hydrolase family protein [Cellulomonas bogoriensis]|uniref:Dienelactone hydrolase n=1 Tax=Cellulomonas bogoriensis 69B4 = DSM 16987 TaxID=1386082 RepID=A0A0A0C2U7_9CELL|nr:acyl-CoA thioester hydrolase/BAAT C-terminal domain-containing protein [Cellulomonas bogoriensis]KGM14302.1 dienelactone hydrolase [Cellulomonas bogoriensis 69B4 = DSM 16987]